VPSKGQGFFASATQYALKAVGIPLSTRQMRIDSNIDSFYEQTDAESRRDNATSNVAKLFYDHKDRLINKWDHHLDVYDRHFSPLPKNKAAHSAC
jgi:hypothetical protein